MCEACPPENGSGITPETHAKLREVFGEPKDPHPDTPIAWPYGSKPPITRSETSRALDKAFGKPSIWGRATSFWSRVTGR